MAPFNTASARAGSRGGVAGKRYAALEPAYVDNRQARDLVAVRKQPSPASLHHRVDEEPVLVDQPGRDQRVAEPDAAGEDDVAAWLVLEPPHGVDGVAAQHGGVLQPGSSRVEETTYFATSFRYAVKPVG